MDKKTAQTEQMHTHADGTTHCHEHTGSHEHGAHSHTHDPEEIRAIVNRCRVPSATWKRSSVWWRTGMTARMC